MSLARLVFVAFGLVVPVLVVVACSGPLDPTPPNPHEQPDASHFFADPPDPSDASQEDAP